MRKILLKRLCRIKIVLTQGECACRSRGPGVYQGHLYYVKTGLSTAEIRATVGNMQVHIGTLVKMTREICIASAHDGVRDGAIDFDPGHAMAAIRDRSKHVYTSTRTDDCIISMWPECIDDARGFAHEMALRF